MDDDFWGEEDQVTIQHLTKVRETQSLEGLVTGARKGNDHSSPRRGSRDETTNET